jgi:IS5 family transposase
MYRKHHNGQLSIEEFHLPFGGTFDPENRWVLFASLMPWEELEETHAPQFSPTTALLQSLSGWHLVRCSSNSGLA